MPSLPSLVLLVLLLPTGLPASDPAAAGQQALDQHDFARARLIYSELVQANPRDFAPHFNLALAELGLGQDAAALEQLRQTVALQPDLYPAHLNLGLVYLRLHQPAEAAAPLRRAAELQPAQARPQLLLGQSLLASSQWTEAAAAFRATLQRDPASAPAELGLGQALLHGSALEQAAVHYRKAATLDASLRPALLELANAYRAANQTGPAIDILAQFPDDAAAQAALGRLQLAANHPAESVAAFERASRLDPSPPNRLALATAYLKNNQPALAAPLLTRALEQAPDDYDLQLAVGRLARDQRKFDLAAQHFQRAVAVRPAAAEAWNELAGASVLAEHYDQALAALDRVHALNAEQAGDYYLRAIVLDRLQQPKPALASYRYFLNASNGRNPNEEFKARQRIRILEKEVSKR